MIHLECHCSKCRATTPFLSTDLSAFTDRLIAIGWAEKAPGSWWCNKCLGELEEEPEMDSVLCAVKEAKIEIQTDFREFINRKFYERDKTEGKLWMFDTTLLVGILVFGILIYLEVK